MKHKTPRDPKYLKFVRSLPCVITGQTGVDAHHLIGYGQSGMGMRSSDYYAFPLRHDLHMDLHNIGWKEWEEKHGLQWKFVAETMQKAILLGLV